MRAVPQPFPCPRCSGSGWGPGPGASVLLEPFLWPVEGHWYAVEPCGCQGDLRRQQRFTAAQIPKRYEHCSLDTFKAGSPTLRNAKARVQEFVDLWPGTDEGRGLLLMGPGGAGKKQP